MSNPGSWEITGADGELFRRELDGFLPHRIFDAHAHFYRCEDFHGVVPELAAAGPTTVGLAGFRDWSCRLAPGGEYSALAFPFPAAGLDFDGANPFVASEVRADRDSRAAMMVAPRMDAEFVRATVRREKFAGLKCYHVYAATQPTFEAEVASYLSAEHVRVAHEEQLAITLHLVRARALADPANQQAIRHSAERYPNARLILAHAGRGFNPQHTIEGIGALKGLRNVWFDSSAVCEGGAYEAIIETMGVERHVVDRHVERGQRRNRLPARRREPVQAVPPRSAADQGRLPVRGKHDAQRTDARPRAGEKDRRVAGHAPRAHARH